MPTLRMTYYPDITQGVPDPDVRQAVVDFGDLLTEQLTADLGTEINVEVPEVMSVPDQYQDIVDGNSHIGLMKPVAYVFAHHVNPQIVPASVAHRPIDGEVGVFYFTQIYANEKLGFQSLDDLRDHGPGKLSIAYGDRFSTSNFLIPAGILKAAGIHPFLFFKSVHFTGGHDLAAEAVYEGNADIGAGHDGVIKILGNTKPDADEKLIQIARENIHSDPVVVHTGILPEPVTLESIQAACATVAKTEKGKASLDLFWGWVKDLSDTEHANYASIENALEQLNLTADDML